MVRSAYKACLTSLEHQLGEWFTFKGHRVYSPHLDIEARIEMCERMLFDKREEPGK